MKRIAERDILPDLIRHLTAEEITLLIGARQSGKTTILKELIAYLSNKKKIETERLLYFNLDLITDLEALSSQPDFIKTLRAYLVRAKNKRLYVFVDEAQRIENAGIFFKGIYDLGLPIKFILSGSSALEMKSKIDEPLTGRKRLFHLYTFSFKEYLGAIEPSFNVFLEKHIALSQPILKRLMELLNEYLIYGGYPKVVLAKSRDEKIKTLGEIYSSYVDKDIVALMKVGEPLVFNNLVRILASEIGALINIHSISSTLKIERHKVENFIALLEKTFIARVAPPYYFNVRKTIKKQPKIYFLDQGIANFATQYFMPFARHPKRGQLLENFVASELTGRLGLSRKLSFWRTRDQAEIDFVINRGNEIIPVEVKASELDSGKVSHSMASFIKHYTPRQMYVVNLSLDDEIKRGSTRIKFILPWDINKIIKTK